VQERVQQAHDACLILPNLAVYDAFCQKFGCDRSKDSIATLVQRLRQQLECRHARRARRAAQVVDMDGARDRKKENYDDSLFLRKY
jgi:hypothetical protein